VASKNKPIIQPICSGVVVIARPLQGKCRCDHQMGNLPLFLSELMTSYSNPINNMALRNRRSFILPANLSTTLRRSAIPSAITLWESIPHTLNNSLSRNGFKYGLRNHIKGTKCMTPTAKLSLSRSCETILNKARCDLLFRSHLYSYNFPNILDPSCMCGYRSQTTIHVLLLCPLFNIQRMDLFNSLNRNLQIHHALNNQNAVIYYFMAAQNSHYVTTSCLVYFLLAVQQT
jgi:hypothetical protein